MQSRNKRSIALDLRSAEGQDIARQLIAQADVLVENFRPGVLDRLGLGWERLHRDYPRLVLASISGFGQTGPYRQRAAYDVVVQAMSGMMSLTGHPGGPPTRAGTSIGDLGAALFACNGIQAALLQRTRTGRGCHVEVPMLEAMVNFTLVEHFYGAHFEPAQSPAGYPRVLAPWRRPYRTLDGHVCMMPYTDAHWQRFFTALGETALAADERFATMAARTRHIDALYETTGLLVAKQDTAYWLALCEKIDVPAARMNQLADLPQDPHLQATGFFETLEDPAMGSLRFPGVPVQFDGQRPPTRMPPRLGADTESVLRQAGVAEDQIQRWTTDGAVGLKPT